MTDVEKEILAHYTENCLAVDKWVCWRCPYFGQIDCWEVNEDGQRLLEEQAQNVNDSENADIIKG